MSEVIYGLVDADTLELRYIGQSANASGRAKVHRRRYPTLRMIILERGPGDLDEAERRWIRKMREQGARLLNASSGGGAGFRGCSHTPGTRTRMSLAHAGRSHTPEHRAKIGVANRITKIGNKNRLGCSLSPEVRAKIGAGVHRAVLSRRESETRLG